jgi:putative DNA primase/helicase
MVQLIKEDVDRCYREAWQRYEGQLAAGVKKPKPPTLVPVTQRLCTDDFHALRSIISIDRPGAAAQPPFWINPQVGDLDPVNLLPVRNGLLDISQDPPQLYAYTPQLFSVSKLAYDYDPNASMPDHWFKLLFDQWKYDAETIHTIHEILGYLLTPDNRMQKIFLWIGPSRSGRGTIRITLENLVGLENIGTTSAASLGRPFGLAPLLNKTVAIMGDARTGDSHDMAVMLDRILRISGGDPVDVDRKNRDSLCGVQMNLRFNIFSNEMPNLRDPAMANVARYLIVKATREIPPEDRDPDLAKKIVASELPAILNLALEGRKRLYARGRFIQPAAANDLIEIGKELASPYRAFIEDCYEMDPKHHEKKLDVFECWKDWAAQQNIVPGSLPHFARNLLAAFQGVIKTARPGGGQDRVCTYQGIKRKTFDPGRQYRETIIMREVNKDGESELLDNIS